ncbi:MAG: haloalkane dehalogenase [Thermoanaerobaculia bacterium]|nr:haloalkane dehalogenase [Thermoanaerobaculia bacterium]
MKILRTPDERFADLADFPFAPRYTDVDGLRMHHVDEGPAGGRPVLLLHGEPTWAYLYRKMIPPLVAAGLRTLAPDLVGFGRSDKPAAIDDYSYAGHVAWLARWLEHNDLRELTLVCQDWGSLLGLRLVAEHPERFAAVVVANGFLPTGDQAVPSAFKLWQFFARWSPWFPISRIVQGGCAAKVSAATRKGYDAPFPSASFKAGARAFPRLVPTTPDNPASAANRAAWKALESWNKPFLTAFGSRDPIFRGSDRVLQKRIPGAAGQPHTTIRGAGHFIQEDRGEELAAVVSQFVARLG